MSTRRSTMLGLATRPTFTVVWLKVWLPNLSTRTRAFWHDFRTVWLSGTFVILIPILGGVSVLECIILPLGCGSESWLTSEYVLFVLDLVG